MLLVESDLAGAAGSEELDRAERACTRAGSGLLEADTSAANLGAARLATARFAGGLRCTRQGGERWRRGGVRRLGSDVLGWKSGHRGGLRHRRGVGRPCSRVCSALGGWRPCRPARF